MIERISSAAAAEATQSIRIIDPQVDGINKKQWLFKWRIEMRTWSELFVFSFDLFTNEASGRIRGLYISWPKCKVIFSPEDVLVLLLI